MADLVVRESPAIIVRLPRMISSTELVRMNAIHGVGMSVATAKIAVLIIAGLVIATGLLALRHERVRTAHAILVEHQRIGDARQAMWDMQVRIADQASPEALGASIGRAHLDMESAVKVQVVEEGDDDE